MLYLSLVALCLWYAVSRDGQVFAFQRLKAMEAVLTEVDGSLEVLAQQLVLNQLYLEQVRRSAGQSGVKLKPMLSEANNVHESGRSEQTTFVPPIIISQPETSRLLRLGDMSVVMNGVLFRTGHNAYWLRKRGQSSANNPYENIEYPLVPREVLRAGSLRRQIDEMRLWFKAWMNQDRRHRDYRKYFKPVICYLEATWKTLNYLPDVVKQEQFAAFSGTADRLNPKHHLPMTVLNVINGTNLIYAKWEFETLCHPLKTDVPLKYFQLRDNLNMQVSLGGISKQDYALKTEHKHYKLIEPGVSEWKDDMKLLDTLMSEVPGMDGAGPSTNKMSYFHRWHRGLGIWTPHLSFEDKTLYVAQTSKHDVVSVEAQNCTGTTCKRIEQSLTYAIPLEIVYLTPLHRWNPYNISYSSQPTQSAQTSTHKNPLDGASSNTFYLTPNEFFNEQTDMKDANREKTQAFVRDPTGVVRLLRASGIYTELPYIRGVGTPRIRFPIMPVHEEGSALWKKFEALKAIALEPGKYKHMMYEDPCNLCS